MSGGPRYRLAQFRRALGARPSAAQLREARDLLNNAQRRLFRGMAPRDQWHCAETLRLLKLSRPVGPDLAVAALLHDAGKGTIRLHERVLFVLLSAWPALPRALAAERGAGWRRSLHRSAHHAETGARLALAAGASARTAELIRRHHAAPAGDAELAALIAADACA